MAPGSFQLGLTNYTFSLDQPSRAFSFSLLSDPELEDRT